MRKKINATRRSLPTLLVCLLFTNDYAAEIFINPCRKGSDEHVKKSDEIVFRAEALPHRLMIRNIQSGSIFYFDSLPGMMRDTEGDFFKIDVSSFSGKDANKNNTEIPVFSKLGRYEIYFADELETEPDNTVWCKTYFVVE